MSFRPPQGARNRKNDPVLFVLCSMPGNCKDIGRFFTRIHAIGKPCKISAGIGGRICQRSFLTSHLRSKRWMTSTGEWIPVKKRTAIWHSNKALIGCCGTETTTRTLIRNLCANNLSRPGRCWAVLQKPANGCDQKTHGLGWLRLALHCVALKICHPCSGKGGLADYAWAKQTVYLFAACLMPNGCLFEPPYWVHRMRLSQIP